MSKLLITRGLPASGKTTFALAWLAEDPDSRVRANRDTIRRVITGDAKKTRLSREQEDLVTKLQKLLVEESFRTGKDVIIDDTNLNAQFLKPWLKLAAKHGVEVEWHDEFLDVSLFELLLRDDRRQIESGDGVGREVITDMYQRYLAGGKRRLKRPEIDVDDLGDHKPYTGTPGKPKAFLVDLDGTIASNGPDRDHPNRGYFDWQRVGEDLPVRSVIDIVRALIIAGLKPLYVSGRDMVCYDVTHLWIHDNVYYPDWADGNEIPYYDRYFDLFMRPEGDNRKDSIVKLEIFDNEIRDYYDVQFCIDDRDQVVKAYRSIGLTVLQVADGDF